VVRVDALGHDRIVRRAKLHERTAFSDFAAACAWGIRAEKIGAQGSMAKNQHSGYRAANSMIFLCFLERLLHESVGDGNISMSSPWRSHMDSVDFRRQLEGFGLTTANILYRLPDHPGILQNYIWQEHDLHPHFPELRKFLDFWSRELDGLLHSVTIAHCRLIKPAEFKAVDGEFRLN
jgi:uncharacterized protein Usg